MHIINGRSTQDKTGSFTFINRNGKSTIDLAKTNITGLNYAKDFKVLDNIIYSDHLPCEILIKHNNSAKRDTRILAQKLKKIYIDLNENKTEKFTHSLENKIIKYEGTKYIQDNYKTFIKSIETSLEDADMMKTNKSNSSKRPFDEKQAMIYQRMPNQQTHSKTNTKKIKKQNLQNENRTLPFCKKKYQEALKKNKNMYTMNIKHKINNIKNPTEIWKTIKSFSSKPHSSNKIVISKWVEFYKLHYGERNTHTQYTQM